MSEKKLKFQWNSLPCVEAPVSLSLKYTDRNTCKAVTVKNDTYQRLKQKSVTKCVPSITVVYVGKLHTQPI
jgi:hypothetical protein